VADFAAQVRQFTDKAQDKLTLAVRKISLEMFSRVILRSPVDTGRFRANWQVAIGSVPTGTLESSDKAGTITVGKAQSAALGVQVGQTIALVNNLPYAQRLENGSSKQAPGGMVALTVQDFHVIAQKIGIEVRRL